MTPADERTTDDGRGLAGSEGRMKYPIGARVQVNAPSYPRADGLTGYVAEYDGSTTPYRVVFGVITTPLTKFLADVIETTPIEDDGWYTEDQLIEATPPPPASD